MLKSMTGYGRSKLQFDGKEYIIEIKSVNHRYVDINVKTPRNISYIEDKIKKMVLNSVGRGKIDVYINCTNIGNSSEKVYINKNLAELKEILSAEDYKKLQLSQTSWENYIDKEYGFINSLTSYTQGTMYLNTKEGWRTEILKQRALTLRGYLNTLKK